MSIAAAAGVVGAALGAAQAAGSAGDGSGTGTSAAGAKPEAPPPSPAAQQLSFDFGDGDPTQSIGTPRAGICYPLGGSATAFRNNTELRAQLYASPGCGGSPGPVLDPGQNRAHGEHSTSVVFIPAGPGGSGGQTAAGSGGR
ncbi:hypothetical protein AB0C51_07390 [Streptomyces pathocidini]|uniref:Uncharacterized protein n=1 Tax=Streptomyces pathocidini TaxID=1650571 RepID=A0ABW7UQW5_9ACTN|nr:hypothetical protein [Streptomyces pathocidini]